MSQPVMSVDNTTELGLYVTHWSKSPSQLYEMYTPTMPILQKRTRGNRNDAQASQYWMNFILFHLIGVGTGCVGGGTREGFVERASGGWVSLDS